MRWIPRTLCAVITLFVTLQSASVSAQPSKDSALNLFPKQSIAVLTVSNPKSLIDTVLEHPIRDSVEDIEDVKKAMKSTEFRQLNVARRVLEYQLEMKWNEAVGQLTKNGLYAAFDPSSNGFAVIAHAKDKATLNSIVEKLVELVTDSKKMGIDAKVKKGKYRGLTTYEVENIVIGLLDDKLLVSNNQKLGKNIADRFLDKSKDSIAAQPKFRASSKLLSNKSAARLFVDMKAIKANPDLAKAINGKAENIGVELLVGGILSNLKNADYAVANLHFDKDHLKITAATPHNNKWVSKPREFFFGPKGKGVAPNLLLPKEHMFSISSYRDIAGLWLAKEDLFGEKHIAELAQADSQFSTLFSGLDFGEEILGALKPGVQIVGSLQDFSKLKTPKPEIKLPAFAAIFQLKDPKKIQQRFKVGFQSVIGFTNIALSQQGQPQLDMETEKTDDSKIVTTTYMADDAKGKGLINYNFSPSVAFVGDYFIISSTDELARELVQIARKGGTKTAKNTNTTVNVDGKALNKILAANRDSLIAQQMLEEGLDEKAASKQIEIFLTLLKHAKDASLDFENHSDHLELKLQLNLKAAK